MQNSNSYLSADGEVLPRAGQCVFECVLCFQSVQCWQCLGKRTGGVLVLIIASKLPHSLSHTHTNSHRHTHRGSRGLNGATVSVLSLLTKSDNASCDKLLFRGTFQKQFTSYMTISGGKKTTLFFLSLSISFSLSTKQLWMKTVHWNRAGSLEHIKLTIRIWRGVTETHRQHERERVKKKKRKVGGWRKKRWWKEERMMK